ncbi:MAG: tRNA lysidine(34) synthetase TilS, partial [Ardenticatenales bacterium]
VGAAAVGRGRERAVLSLPGRIRLTVTPATTTFSPERTAIPPPRLGPEPVPLAVPGETRLPGGWSVSAVVDEGRGAGGGTIGGGVAGAIGGAVGDVIGGGRGGDPWRIVIDGDVIRGPLAARGRLPGDQLPLAGMGTGHKRLQDLFVDAKVPAAERDGWPIIVAGGTIVWVAGLRADARFVAGAGTGRRVVLTVGAPGRVVGGGAR